MTVARPLLVSVAVVVLILGTLGYAGFTNSQRTPVTWVPVTSQATTTLTAGTVFGGFITIHSVYLPQLAVPTGTVQFKFLVNSSVSGPWEFGVANEGADVFPPPELGMGPPVEFPLVPYVSAQFPNGDMTGTLNSTVVVVDVTTSDAPLGVIPLEFVVMQQQEGQLIAMTSYPFNLTIVEAQSTSAANSTYYTTSEVCTPAATITGPSNTTEVITLCHVMSIYHGPDGGTGLGAWILRDLEWLYAVMVGVAAAAIVVYLTKGRLAKKQELSSVRSISW